MTKDKLGKKELIIKGQKGKKIKDIRSKIKQTINTSLSVAGYVHYFWNTDHLESSLKPIPFISNPLTIKSTQESFLLGKPAYHLDVKPVFICLREIPYSIELELLDGKDRKIEIDGKTKLLKELNYTPSEIYAKVHSLYHHYWFKSKRLSKTDVIIYILSMLLSILGTSIVFMMIP